MCGRFTLKTPAADWLPMFGIDASISDSLHISPRYNIAPTQLVSAIRMQDESRSAVQLRWGLIPFWAKDKSIGNRMINARSETAASKPAFRAAFKSRRCLVVADGFYEWLKTAEGKQPVHICMQDRQPFAFAGLWESWREKNSDADSEGDDNAVESCTILTTSSNELLADVHDRMPVILDPDDYDLWLDSEFKDSDQLQQLMLPFDSGEMEFFKVSKTVNSPKNDVLECVEPIQA